MSTDIQLNHYSQVLNYIREVALSDPLVRQVTKGKFKEEDKETKRPFVHINIASGSLSNTTTVTFDVQVGAFADRVENKEPVEDKFWRQDNEVDNLNTTLAILNKMWAKMYLDFNENSIFASENPNINVFEDGVAALDGWILDFTLEMPNTSLNLCNS